MASNERFLEPSICFNIVQNVELRAGRINNLSMVTKDIRKMDIHPSEMHHQSSEGEMWFLGQISPKWQIILRLSISYKYIVQMD